MRHSLAAVLGVLLTGALTGCQNDSVGGKDEPRVDIRPGVSRELAAHRAARFLRPAVQAEFHHSGRALRPD